MSVLRGGARGERAVAVKVLSARQEEQSCLAITPTANKEPEYDEFSFA